jgi:AraC-like DNA-binding protein
MFAAPLAPLPFGAATAMSFDSEAACGEFMARFPDAPSRFGAIGPAAKFRIRLRNVALPDVSLVAGAGTAKATTHLGRRAALVIPFARCETVLRTAAGTHRWAAPHHAFFIPAGEQIAAESTAGAFLRLDIVEDALARTAAGMAGEDADTRAIDLRVPRPVPLQALGSSWLPAIQSLCDTVDALGCDAGRLAAAGIDDVILRTVVTMLRPELALDAGRNERSRAVCFDLLLERITAHLGGRLTLADMERWSGLSARTIQLAFQRRFGLGPMQWVRERRLDLLRARLLAAPRDAKVSMLAASCGFTRLATATVAYAERFGELPSETLRRSDR